MDKNDIREFKNSLLQGDFDKAKLYIKDLDNEKIYDLIVEINFNDESMVSYCFLASLLHDNETAELHINAASFLTFFLFHIQGAYNSALYHLRQAIKLDPDNIEYQELLLHFNEIPDRLVSQDEAIAVAKNILKDKSDSSVALRILSDYKINN
ncbi:MAG: tetratricopeptide repeat protein [Candidatus Babeliales bacterium]